MSPKVKLWLGAALLAPVLVANAAYLTARAGDNERRSLGVAWERPLAGVTSIVRTPVKAGEGPVLVLTSPSKVSVLGAAGDVRREAPLKGATVVASATGDLTGDGIDDLLVLGAQPEGALVQAWDGEFRGLWRMKISSETPPERILGTDFDGDGRREVVVAFRGGTLVTLSAQGDVLWQYALPPTTGEGAEVRGLDDPKWDDAHLVALARRDGSLALVDGAGQQVWAGSAPTQLRRLRAVAVKDGDDRVVVGGDDGVLREVLRRPNPTGPPVTDLVDVQFGQLDRDITELRAVETDGALGTREFVAGDKDGCLVLIGGGHAGARMSAQARIVELRGIDMDGDGRDEIAAAREDGELRIFDTTSLSDFLRTSVGGRVEAMASVTGNAGERLLLVAVSNAVRAYRQERHLPPNWLRPWLAAVAGLLGLIVVTAGLAALRPAPQPTTLAAPPDALTFARRERLLQARAKLEALRSQGQAKDIEERLAQIERELTRLSDSEADPGASSRRPVRRSPPPPKQR